MPSRLLRRLGLPLASVALVLAAAAVVVAVVALEGDEPDEEVVAPEPEPEPAPQPEPEPEPEPPPPVDGEVELAEVVDLSASGTGLFQPGSEDDQPVPPDEEAVDALLDAVAAWLDDVLTSAHREGEVETAGLVGPDGLLLLGDPDHPITAAHYRVTVGARGAPEWAEVSVTATREDGSERRALVVFEPDDEGARLVAAGPDPGEDGEDDTEEEA